MIASHHSLKPDPLPEAPLAGVSDTAVGNSRPDSVDASSAGSVLNSLVAWFHEIWPPLKFWVTVSPSTVSSAVGTPSVPVAPPSFAHAVLMAPRTTMAPLSGVQKMTGLSAALKALTRLLGTPPSDSVPIG